MLRVRELDVAMVEVIDDILELLKDEWGRWDFEPETQTNYFESDESIARYDEGYTRLSTLIAEQEEAARKALDGMS